jgi:hypothetical protein
MNRALTSSVRLALGVAATGGLLTTCFPAEAATTVYELAQVTHFHGLAVDAPDSSRLYLATHHGLFIVEPRDGTAYPLSEIHHDLMASRRIQGIRRSSTPAAIRPGAAISALSPPKTAAGPGASSPRAWAVRGTSTSWP